MQIGRVPESRAGNKSSMPDNCTPVFKSVLVIAFAGFLTACDAEKSRNPLSPSIAGPIEGVTISSPSGLKPTGGFLVRVGDQPVQLTFNQVTSNSERPYWYELQVSRDSAFADVTHSAHDISPSGTHTDIHELGVMLNADQMYYWRVRALDGANTGPYSTAASFEVYTPLIVEKPTLASPVGGAVTGTQQPTLVANNASITGPAISVMYQFEVSTDPNFGTTVSAITISAGGSTTTATAAPLPWNTLYYWRSRVLAQGKEGQVEGPWSEEATFQTGPQPVVLGVPTLVTPINNALTATNPPAFTVSNGLVTGSPGSVTIFFHIGTDPSVENVVTVFETPQSSSGTTTATSASLPANSTLYWRVFAGDGSTVSPWTSPQTFRTPANATSPPDDSTNEPPPPGCCPPPNRFAVVQQVASETGYPHSGIHVTDFTQIVAERLHAENPHWGRRINITGPLGKDTVAYKASDGRPYSIDIVLGASGDDPRIHWDEHGFIGGTWVVP